MYLLQCAWLLIAFLHVISHKQRICVYVFMVVWPAAKLAAAAVVAAKARFGQTKGMI